MVKNALVFLLFLALSILVTWPLALNLNHLIIDRYDSLLITWIQNWWLHSFSLNGNIFYPYQNTLVFSDYHLVSAVLAAPFVWIFKEPLMAFNVNLILGFALTGFSGYLLAKHLTHREPVSILAGILLTFSTIHLNYMAHPQLFHLWLIIFPILFLLKERYFLYSLFFVLASINSPLNLYFLLFLAVFLKGVRRSVLPILFSLPFLLPYLLVSRQFHYTRPITDAINFSLQFPDLANVSIFSRLGSLVAQQPGTPAYPGAVFLFLVFIVMLNLFQHLYRSRNKFGMTLWLWTAAGSFILALGPALHIFRDTIHVGPIPFIPLPYSLLYYLLPGFSGFRTPSRWIILTALCLCVAVSIYFAKKITWPWAIILSILVLTEVNFPFHYYQIPKPPPEQIWLKEHFVGAPIIQFPIYGWFDPSTGSGQAVNGVGLETLRMYYSTIHWHPMFNGYSGFSPREWEDRVRWLQKNFPSDESVSFLRNLQIKLVLAPSSWQIPLKLVAEFPNTKVYEIY